MKLTKYKPQIEYPWNTESFKEQWELWKQYKKEEHKFKYRSPISEQAALRKLSKLTNYEHEAINILHQSIENGWKGLFKLKTDTNIYGKLSQDGLARLEEAFEVIDRDN